MALLRQPQLCLLAPAAEGHTGEQGRSPPPRVGSPEWARWPGVRSGWTRAEAAAPPGASLPVRPPQRLLLERLVITTLLPPGVRGAELCCGGTPSTAGHGPGLTPVPGAQRPRQVATLMKAEMDNSPNTRRCKLRFLSDQASRPPLHSSIKRWARLGGGSWGWTPENASHPLRGAWDCLLPRLLPSPRLRLGQGDSEFLNLQTEPSRRVSSTACLALSPPACSHPKAPGCKVAPLQPGPSISIARGRS